MIVFTDLDDTFIKTKRKLSSVENYEVGAVSQNGEASSFISQKQKTFFDALDVNSKMMIPVTARSLKTFSNVSLKFNSYAILNFGATIYDIKNKSILKNWNDKILSFSEQLGQKDIFKVIIAKVLKECLPLKVEYRLENEIDCFINFRFDNKQDFDNIFNFLRHILLEMKLEKYFYIYSTDRDITILPKFINKRDAVKFFIDEFSLQNEFKIGLGDNVNDFGFMSLCDYSVFPNNSNIAKIIYGDTE